MTLPHERIWAKPRQDSWDQYGHWYRDGVGGGTEYVRADVADGLTAEVAALKAENERLRDALADHPAIDARKALKGKRYE